MFGCCVKGPNTPPTKRKGNNSSSKENLVESNKKKNKGKRDNSPKKGQTNKAINNNNNPKYQQTQQQKKSQVHNNNNIVKPESIVLREKSVSPKMAANLESLVSRLEVAVSKLEAQGGGASSAGSGQAEATAPYVAAYEEIINGPFQQYLAHSATIGEDVKTQADIVKGAFQAQREFLAKASKAKSPSQDVLVKLLQPTSEKISGVQAFRESNRRSPFFNHLSAISESVPALGWVAVSPTPGPFVKEMVDAGQFYSNRVLKEFKEKDKVHVDWVKSWGEVLSKLQAYIKQYHTTGVSWNPKGVDAASVVAAKGGSAPPPPPPAGGPPPPPPPPPASDVSSTGAVDSGDSAKSALFADLNKGEGVTKGLKKVSDDMKTHKNPGLRKGPAPYKPHISPKPVRAVQAPAKKVEVKKPAKCALEGKKWNIEYQHGNKNILLDDTERKQSVYIFRCVDSVVQVKGKVNSIVMDSCKKSAVVFDSVVSSVEFVNCQSVQGQVNEKVPTVSIDKTDGCMMYLSKDSSTAEIVTAKSSEMNILIPDASGEYKEYAIPEQFKTVFNGKKLVTGATDIV